MTAATPGPTLFSTLSTDHESLFGSRTRSETFLISLLGQAAILAVIIYLTTSVIRNPPISIGKIPRLGELPLVFHGHNGGGGGNHDPLPASNGMPPHGSLQTPIVSPTVFVPTEMHRLMVEASVMVAPEVTFPVSTQIGDPSSPFSKWLSDGPGGPNGIGTGCCGGIGPDSGPYVGQGAPGIWPAGQKGVSVPEAIYAPEPSFSEEARKVKHQGIVLLMLVVGKDGKPYDIRVRQSLGMGLDEKAIEAVKQWRFRPAILNGQPVATRIGVQVDFHLY